MQRAKKQRAERARRTRLELHVVGAARTPIGPLDVLAEGRRRFLRGSRLDMRELAADLKISRATLYRWVGDRERLLGEILWSLAERGLADARAYAGDAAGPEWVVRFYSRFMEIVATFEPIRRFVETEPDAALRVLTSSHGVQRLRLIQTMRGILEEKASAGELALRLPAEDLAFVMIRVGESFIWREFITGEEPDISRAADVVRVLLS